MKEKYVLLAFTMISYLGHTQSSVNSSGSDLTGNGSVSYSLGQLTTNTISGNGTSAQGVQMAYEQFELGLDDVIGISAQAIVYPNPTEGTVTLEIPNAEKNSAYTVVNSEGKTLLQGAISGELTTVPTNELSSGIYFLNVLDQNNASTTFKLIKK